MRFLLAVVVSSALLFLPAFAQRDPDEFTIVALPDTQIYARSYPQIYAAQTRWIADNAAALNIQLVVGLGDIVDGGGDPAQWQNADAAMRLLDGKVPYMLAIGNHDYDRNAPVERTAATTNFNSYFGPSRYTGQAWYRGQFPAGSNENFYGIHNLAGRQYLVLVLEFSPRDSALNWASSVVAANADKDVIVVTHSFTASDNTRIGRCDPNNSEAMGVGADNDGEEMWQKFVSRHPNIVMVLSGHHKFADGTGRRSDLGANGNLVNQILADYQHLALGGEGYLRILRVRPSVNQVEVSTYSPYVDAYKTDVNNQFVLPYKASGLASTTTTITGQVRSALDCAPLSKVDVSHSAGSGRTDSSGMYSLPAPSPGTVSLTARLGGWLPATRTATAIAGLRSPAEFFLSTAGKLEGYVTDSAGTPVAGAAVTVVGGTLSTTAQFTTSSSGFFTAGWIAVGTYKVEASHSAYSPAQATATVTAGATTTTRLKFSGSGGGPACAATGPDGTITICAPAAGATVASPVRVTATPSSINPVVHMKIYVDHVEAYAANTDWIDTQLPLAAGPHYLVVQAWDNAGRVFRNSVSISVGAATTACIATVSPGVTVCTPAHNTTVGTPFRVTAAATSPNTITAMRIYANYQSVYTVNAASIDTNLTLAAGTQYLTVQAWDATGAVFKTSLTVQVAP